MTVKKWFTPPARAHGNASHHHTHGQGMCGDHWEHLGPIPYAVRGVVFMEGVHTTPTRSPVTNQTNEHPRT